MKALLVVAIVASGALILKLGTARGQHVEPRPARAQVQAPPAAVEDSPAAEELGPGLAESAYAFAPIAPPR